ncbi:hypothetical protein [Haladaptatus sp. NG-SE-30]
MPETTTTTRTQYRTWQFWVPAIVSGLFAGLIMGYLMRTAMPIIGGLYGQPTVLAGWVAHLFHSVVFALIFVAIITRPQVKDYANTIPKVGILGAIYGFAMTFVTAGVVLPLWAGAVGAADLPFPFLPVMEFTLHLVYGIVLGVTYGVIRSQTLTKAGEAQPT